MKTRQLYTFLIGSLFLFPQFLIGQDWFKEGAEWVFRYGEHWGASGYEEVSIIGDTIIENKICKVFERTRTTVNRNIFNSDTSVWTLNNLIMYEQNDSVFFYFNDEFTLCYNFNLNPFEPGEVCFDWENEESPNSCPDIGMCYTVVDTGSIEINGISRRYQDCHTVLSTPEWEEIFRIVEGIGKINSFSNWGNIGGYIFLPLDYNCFLDSDEWSFCSYSDNEVTYQEDEDQDCYFLQNIVNVEELNPSNSKITLTPNPFQDFLQIEIKNNIEIQQIQIFDRQGKIIFSEKGGSQQIDLSHLSNGVYFILMETLEGTLSQKIIKSNF